MSEDQLPAHLARFGLPEPATIRPQLPPDVAVVFDREWESVLDDAKQTQNLRSILDLAIKWRFIAHAETTEPGSYFRTLETAERILATGAPSPGSISGDEVRALIAARLRDAGLESEAQGQETPPAT